MSRTIAIVESEIPDRIYGRAQANADFDPLTGCLVSRYSVGSHGYAQVGWNDRGDRKVMLAHRVSWIYTFGPIPEHLTIDHLCKNRRCVNVVHMRLLTNYENARRTDGRDWPLGQCVNGHPNERLRVQPNGKRVCIDCNKGWQARYREKVRNA